MNNTKQNKTNIISNEIIISRKNLIKDLNKRISKDISLMRRCVLSDIYLSVYNDINSALNRVLIMSKRKNIDEKKRKFYNNDILYTVVTSFEENVRQSIGCFENFYESKGLDKKQFSKWRELRVDALKIRRAIMDLPYLLHDDDGNVFNSASKETTDTIIKELKRLKRAVLSFGRYAFCDYGIINVDNAWDVVAELNASENK